MDLQGIGAMGAVLVGRWQTRAALRSAEATSQAGISQAQATYRAAHHQWRRGIRRDAWAAFLLAVEDAVSSATAALTGADEDLHVLRRAMKTTLVVLELEGPSAVVEAATLLRRTSNDYLDLIEGDMLWTPQPTTSKQTGPTQHLLRSTTHECRWISWLS